MLVHHQERIASTTACGITEEKIANSELVITTNDNWSKVNCGNCIRKYRRAHPRIHFQPMPGARTTCGIMPHIVRRPTQVKDNWLGVTCQECLAMNVPKALPRSPARKPSAYNYRTNHPAWAGTLADVKAFLDRYGRPRVFPRGLPGKLSGLQNEMNRTVGKSPLLGADFAYHGSRTGRWVWGKTPNLYSGKLSENLIQGMNSYKQMMPRITGNRADYMIIDDPIVDDKITATELNRKMEKAWLMLQRYGGTPDVMYCSDAFLDAYRKDLAKASALEGILNFNYKDVEARVNAAFSDALLYGSASYKIDNSETPTISKENAMSAGLQVGNPFARHFGFNPAEFVPARHGQPWDYESDSRLIRFLKGGFSVDEIARELQRSEVSIECRITFLAYKEERATLLAAGIAKLTAEPKAKRVTKRKAKKSKGRK